MGLFKKLKQSTGHQDESLKEHGILGTAKVISSKESILGSGSDSDDALPMYFKNTLEITIPGEPPFKVETRMKSEGKPGAEWPVYVDPDDHQNVFADRPSVQLGSWGQGAMTPEAKAMVEQKIVKALATIRDPAQRKVIIDQYRKSGINLDDDGNVIAPPAGDLPPPG
jgi:hypothetical protein